MSDTYPIDYQNGHLCFDGHSVESLAAEYGTPLYLYSADSIERSIDAYHAGGAASAMAGQVSIHYAVKAASNLSLLRLIADCGCGADIVSGGELSRALEAGFRAESIVYSGVGKSEPEIEAAIVAGIQFFAVESEAELYAISRVAERIGAEGVPIGLRVNPDVDAATHPYISTGLKENKFGVAWSEALRLYRLAADLPGLRPLALGCHIGSQLTTLDGFVAAARRLRTLADEVVAAGLELRYLDAGGGLGIDYVGGAVLPSIEEYVQVVAAELVLPDVTLLFEPGRSIVGRAGALLTRVLYEKENEGRRFFICDAAMNDLIRPALYAASHPLFAGREESMAKQVAAQLVGPICESGDFLARGDDLPDLRAGDLVLIAAAGAYGFTMSSNYNSRPRSAELLVESDGAVRLIRRRESYDDLVAAERLSDQ